MKWQWSPTLHLEPSQLSCAKLITMMVRWGDRLRNKITLISPSMHSFLAPHLPLPPPPTFNILTQVPQLFWPQAELFKIYRPALKLYREINEKTNVQRS